jgi:hypothetical protein
MGEQGHWEHQLDLAVACRSLRPILPGVQTFVKTHVYRYRDDPKGVVCVADVPGDLYVRWFANGTVSSLREAIRPLGASSPPGRTRISRSTPMPSSICAACGTSTDCPAIRTPRMRLNGAGNAMMIGEAIVVSAWATGDGMNFSGRVRVAGVALSLAAGPASAADYQDGIERAHAELDKFQTWMGQQLDTLQREIAELQEELESSDSAEKDRRKKAPNLAERAFRDRWMDGFSTCV